MCKEARQQVRFKLIAALNWIQQYFNSKRRQRDAEIMGMLHGVVEYPNSVSKKVETPLRGRKMLRREGRMQAAFPFIT